MNTVLPLLSRYAECIFWLGRYMERAESLARIIDVTHNFSQGRTGESSWLPIVQINADVKRFFERHKEATMETVTDFYLLDNDNPTSIIFSVHAARENARTLRPLISTEMWTQLNIFHLWLTSLTDDDLADPKLSGLCQQVKERCQAHTGIVEGTFYRDQGWYFYQLGKQIERADQTSRLVDIKYHTLLPSVADVGSPLDSHQWYALLRAAAGYHAFRRVFPQGMNPRTVAAFLLFNEAFPRAVICSIRLCEWYVQQLRSRYDLRQGSAALERLDELRLALTDHNIDTVISQGLHQFCDWIQRQLIDIQIEIGRAFFDYDTSTTQAA